MGAYIKKCYRESLTLLTDFYQLTMLYGYWRGKISEKRAVFHLFYRTIPFCGGYALSAGLESVVEYLQNFHFDQGDLEYLRSLKSPDGSQVFEEGFLFYLSSLRFTCNLDAVQEGTVIYPYEPILRIEGPLAQCQLFESILLNLMNFPSLIATKASRIRLAAGDDELLEFGMRRAQGIDGALSASRASYIGGCDATSNVLAGKLWKIPVKGTHSHSWVMLFSKESESFDAYAEAMPQNCIFLVDTYNTLQGVKNAIEAGKKLKEKGFSFLGIRLDSGDLADLSRKARTLLDQAGFTETKIVASNELDEQIIRDLKLQGAKINVWGVGTNLVTGKGCPSFDGVYKLSAVKEEQGWSYRLKLSEQMKKTSNPGILQVRRFQKEGTFMGDMIYDVLYPPSGKVCVIDPFDPIHEWEYGEDAVYEDLLVPIFREGCLVYALPELEQIRARTMEQLQALPEGVKRFLNAHKYPVGLEKSLNDVKLQIIRELKQGSSNCFCR